MAITSDARRKSLPAGLIALLTAALAPTAMLADPIIAGGYTFTSVDFPNSGTNAASGTNINGIANNGAAVGFSIDNNGAFNNFDLNPNGTFTPLNLNRNAMAFGINNAGDVVGQQNAAAFILPPGGAAQTLAGVGNGSTAFGINDQGNIVGQYTSGAGTPGFLLANNSLITINSPSPANIVNAQGINNNGLIIGFYLGADGQVHGFDANAHNANNGILPVNAIADPRIPGVPGEPGATFVFSQILGINDNGIAVGYYGDSTTSQHGFLLNTNTGVYTFLDDPSEQFNNGVEVTQITGITDSGEIAGFYSDANGIFHGFVGCPVGMTCPNAGPSAVPEPASGLLTGLGLGFFALGWLCRRKARSAESF